MNAYAQRLGHLAPEQLQAALDRFELGRLISTSPVTTGNFGQNLFLSTTTGEYVFRGNPLRDYQFAKEQHFARVLHEQTSVPVPWPYHHESSSDLFGWEYAIMLRLGGVPLAELAIYDRLTFDDRTQIAESMARTLAALQSATHPYPGIFDLASRSIIPFDHGYREWVEHLIRENLDRAIDLTQYDHDWVRDVVRTAQPAMSQNFSPSFVHCDFSIHNVVADRDNGSWHVTGVFDLMSAHIGDGEFDLARQFAVHAEDDARLAVAFLTAYLRDKPPRAGFRDRFCLYIVNERLSIWEWAKRTNVAWWPPDVSLRSWIEGFLAVIPAIL